MFLKCNTIAFFALTGAQTNDKQSKTHQNKINGASKSFILNSKKICTIFLNRPSDLLKEKADKIKIVVPQMSIRNFAFGSSFLLLVMTSILQRQNQNSWYFPFIRQQIPGVCIGYHENSWECFENITSKYLNNNKRSKTCQSFRSFSEDVFKLNVLKNIHFQKDQLYIDFSEPWQLQFIKDFTGVISRVPSFKNQWIVQPFYQMHAKRPYHHLCKSHNVGDNKSIFAKRMLSENNTIPSKMACSANTRFADNYKIRNCFSLLSFAKAKTKGTDFALAKPCKSMSTNLAIKKVLHSQKQNVEFASGMQCEFCTFIIHRKCRAPKKHQTLEKRKYIERKNDILKKFFYEYGFFSIPTKVFSKVLLKQTFNPKNFVFNSKIGKKQNLHSMPFKEQNLQDLARTCLEQPTFCISKTLEDFNFSHEIDLQSKFSVEKSPLYKFQRDKSNSWNRSINIPIEKVSSYVLYKIPTINSRLMSGYKSAEIEDLQAPSTNKVYIKIPPALPFYDTKFYSFLRKIVYQPIENSTFINYKNVNSKKTTGYIVNTKQNAGKNKTEKKLPYQQFSLIELQEIKPLFEKVVNQEIRISPHKIAFQKPFFTDYSDYLSRPKDSPPAISISPSLEEDHAIHQSRNEHIEREALINQNIEKYKSFKENSIDPVTLEGDFGSRLNRNESTKEARIDPTHLESEALNDFQFEEVSNKEDKEENEEEKKKEITKWEWLHNVREAELDVEKRKNFQKFAYPNKEALFIKRLLNFSKVLPQHTYRSKQQNLQTYALEKHKTFSFRKIPNLLVTDRKSSFFGITNIFPKRLVAEDQRQINNQILREDEDSYQIEDNDVLLLENLVDKKKEKNLDFAEVRNVKQHRDLTNEPANLRVFKDLPEHIPSLSKKHLENLNVPKVSLNQNVEDTEGLPLSVHSEGAKQNRRYTSIRKVGSETLNKQNQEIFSSLRIVPRVVNFLSLDSKHARATFCFNKTSSENLLLRSKTKQSRVQQHPVYTPNRRLRLRVAESLKASQNNNPQSRIDSLNLCQSHRWWQKRRVTSSLLGAPSKRYMVMPEIKKADWRKIIEWQLKTYFLEEEKRLQPFLYSTQKEGTPKMSLRRFALVSTPADAKKATQVQDEGKTKPSIESSQEIQSGETSIAPTKSDEGVKEMTPKQNFKIKKIAIYLPWLTLKKSLKKPFEWPLTRLSYQSQKRVEDTRKKLAFDLSAKGTKKKGVAVLQKQKLNFLRKETKDTRVFLLRSHYPEFASQKIRNEVFRNKKPDSCLVSSLSPQFKAFAFTRNLDEKEKQAKIRIYKPFIFEMATKDSHLLFHQLLLAIALKQILQKIYSLFGKIIVDTVKSSSLGIALLPLFLNAYSRKNQISALYHLKKRLKGIVGSDDTVSSLSEIVWYLRNSCRGRLVPRGVVLVETHNSDSTEFLKAVGGEAQVPVIVESLRALTLTQNHPQRRLEKILKFAEKRAPCILFLDDLDAIGKVRTLLINGDKDNARISPFSKQLPNSLRNRNNFSIGNTILRFGFSKNLEKEKWKRYKNDFYKYKSKTDFVETHVQIEDLYARFALANAKRNKKKDQVNSASCIYSASLRNSESQKAHTFLLNDFLMNQGFAKQTFDRGFASSNQNLDSGNEVGFALAKRFAHAKPKPNSSRACKQGVNNTNIRFTRSPKISKMPENSKGNLNSIVTETEKIIEQRRLDLMLRLLTVMDGISHLKGVLIVTTSKNPSSLDPALLRPGRFERFIHLKSPNKKRRIEFLKIHTSKIGHTNSMPWGYLGEKTKNMSGVAISDAINHSAFRSIIKSTVHTLSTLEYGINRVNGEAFTNNKNALCFDLAKPSKFGCSRLFDAPNMPRPMAQEIIQKPLHQKREENLSFAKAKIGFVRTKSCSQISFYQAGKGVIQSLFFANKRKDFTINTLQHSNLRSIAFAQNVVQLYAGSASESLYLDSLTTLKKKAFLQGNSAYKPKSGVFKNTGSSSLISKFGLSQILIQQFPFLKSNLSYKDQLQSISYIDYILNNLNPFTVLDRKCVLSFLNKNRPLKMQRSQPSVEHLACHFLYKKKSSTPKMLFLSSFALKNQNIDRYLAKEKIKSYKPGQTKTNLKMLLKSSFETFVFRSHFSTRLCTNRCKEGDLKNVENKTSKTKFLDLYARTNTNRKFISTKDFTFTGPSKCVQITDLMYQNRPTVPRKKQERNSAIKSPVFSHPFAYYNLILSCFYISFQNLSENRELLDLLADHLIRFKFLRSHEIIRISSFYMGINVGINSI
uniref:cell division protein n=1 Tax=Polulichloris maxima TaxID=2704661 RepID=UPI002410FC93|nr:cell division protein [Polulichloris maxima]WDY13259.1 cell division protein [Polulichloris maxima]